MRIDKQCGAYLDRQRDAEFNRARHDFVNRTFDDTLCTDVFYMESPAALARADGTVMRRRATYVNVTWIMQHLECLIREHRIAPCVTHLV